MNTKFEALEKPVIAVLGAGHGGMAMAGHLALMGFEVNLFNRGEERLCGVRSLGCIELTGEVVGFFDTNALHKWHMVGNRKDNRRTN